MPSTQQISFFLPSLQGGGAERVLVQLVNSFHLKGYQVELVVGDANGPYRQEVHPDVRVIDFKKQRVLSCLLPLVRYLRARRPLALYTTMMHANVLSIIAKGISGVATRVVVREANTTESTNGKPVEESKSALLRIAARVYPRAHAVVCVSHGVKNSLMRDLNLSDSSKLSVIYNPVISDQFYTLANEPTPLLTFKRKNASLLVAVGRLQKAKDYPTLLRAFAIFRQNRDSQLLILGEGTEREKLESMISDLGLKEDVLMPGFVSNPFAYMKEADLFVHSSLYEGMPNSIIQALALHKRAVVTRTKDGPAELFDGVEGVKVVSTGQPEAFANAVEQMLVAVDVREPSEQWFTMFSKDAIVSQYEQFAQ